METKTKLNCDPMMEIFMEECLDLVTQYETYLSMADEKQAYDMTLIDEIFRITHTIKADATMMLFECIAIPMRALERLLYYYRDESKGVVNYREFTLLISDVICFLKEELQKIEDQTASSEDGDALKLRLVAYRDFLASELAPEQVELVEEKANKGLREEPMRFYIGSQQDTEKASGSEAEKTKVSPIIRSRVYRDVAKTTEQECGPVPTADQEPDIEKNADADENGEYHWIRRRSAVSAEELLELCSMIEGMTHLEAKLTKRFHDRISEVNDILLEFRTMNLAMLDWVANAWMTPIGYITPKLHRTVEEMNNRLGKRVSLEISGENILIEKSWIDKLSGTLVHLIRNSMDHGIETKETRIACGKNPDGAIQIEYRKLSEPERFELRITDNGRGLNVRKIHQAAIERNLIGEDETVSPEEIIQFIFAPGLTTNEKAGVYSGRGVGMDAVWHNVKDLGGEIRVESHEGEGMTVIMTIPFQNMTNFEEEAIDEDFDSRR